MTTNAQKRKPDISKEKKKEIGAASLDGVRRKTIEECEKVGLTVRKVAKTVAEALEANQVKVQLDMKGKWKVSEEFADHVTRLKAVEQGITLLDLKPTEKHKIDLMSSMSDGELDHKLEDILTAIKEKKKGKGK